MLQALCSVVVNAFEVGGGVVHRGAPTCCGGQRVRCKYAAPHSYLSMRYRINFATDEKKPAEAGLGVGRLGLVLNGVQAAIAEVQIAPIAVDPLFAYAPRRDCSIDRLGFAPSARAHDK